jgi:alkanesulfonate monooxygenase SsuD/methylene tetrahydromethanopterin reductase-like flavin-dependent oxidoreductase (luciferase family)
VYVLCETYGACRALAPIALYCAGAAHCRPGTGEEEDEMAFELGWVLQPTSRTRENTATMLEANRAHLAKLRPPFTTLWVEDHFQWEDSPTLEVWTAMCFAAGEFQDLKVGSLTLGQSYRNPALTAKMAAVLHATSGGRLILGIGAGWKEDEYRAYGYPFPSAGTRIAQLREAVEIMRLMWTESPASYQGEHYRIDRAFCEPRHATPPPIMIGGGGERKTMRVAAELADWWNIGFRTLDEYKAKVEVLHRHCADVGRDPGSLLLSYYGHVAVARDPATVERIDPVRPNIHRLAGTPAEVAEQLNGFLDFGVRHIMLKFADFPRTDQLDLFMDEVVPLLHRG